MKEAHICVIHVVTKQMIDNDLPEPKKALIQVA